jgi:hypothetical protein
MPTPVHVSDRYASRLRRYAICSAAQAIVVVVAVAASPLTPVAPAIGFVALLLLFWTWGPFQAEVALNPRFDDADRRRWRLWLACVPGTAGAYWYLHIRPFAP